MHSVIVLGGYGFFGSCICDALAKNQNIHLLVGGRDITKAQATARKLGLTRSGNCYRRPCPLVTPLHAISQWMEPFVSDKGAMFVSLEGQDIDGQPLKLDWHLIAAQNHGPYIPCGAAIALATKLAGGDSLRHGAMPCVGLLSLEDYLAALNGFDVKELAP